MKQLNNFTKDESGAVTVDWVVLTAAIVGIALAVITLISSGVEDASTGINDELNTASAFTFSFGGGGAGTMSAYNDTYGGDRTSIITAIHDDAPAGYEYVGFIDTATDTAIYEDTSGSTGNLSINGEVVAYNDYIVSGALYEAY